MVLPSHIDVHLKKAFRAGDSKASWGVGSKLTVLVGLPNGHSKTLVSSPVRGSSVSEDVTWGGPFTLTSFGETSLEISLENEKTKLLKRHSPIGRVVIPLTPLYEKKELEGTFTLLSKDGKDSGTIVVSLKHLVPRLPPSEPSHQIPSVPAALPQPELEHVPGPESEPTGSGYPSLGPPSSAYPQVPTAAPYVPENHYPQLEGRGRSAGPLDYHDPYSRRSGSTHSYLSGEQSAAMGAEKVGGTSGLEEKSKHLEYGAKPAYPTIGGR